MKICCAHFNWIIIRDQTITVFTFELLNCWSTKKYFKKRSLGQSLKSFSNILVQATTKVLFKLIVKKLTLVNQFNIIFFVSDYLKVTNQTRL